MDDLKNRHELNLRQSELCELIAQTETAKLPNDLRKRIEFIYETFSRVGGSGEVIMARSDYLEDARVRYLLNMDHDKPVDWPQIK